MGNGQIQVLDPSPAVDAYYFRFRRLPDGTEYGVPFGYRAEPLAIRWDLPDNVCGLYVAGECFLLFRYGAGRRRRRDSYRVGQGEGFNQREVEWFCAKAHSGQQSTAN